MRSLSALLIMATLALPGCMVVRSPMLNSTNLSATDFSNLDSARTANACQTWFLAFPVGKEKASIATAIEKAGVSQVLLVEYTDEAGFLTTKDCVTVWGE